MIIKPIHDLLCVAVPDQRAHIVRSTGKNVSMVRAEFYAAHRQRMSCQHHNWLLTRAPQVPNLDRIIGRGGRYKVFVLVEVHREDLIGMRVDPLDVFALAYVPNSDSLITAARAKNGLVSRMPDGRIAGEIMDELGSLSHGRGIPHLDLHICRTCQDRTLVQVAPLDAINFGTVRGHHLNRGRLWRGDIPQPNVSITACAEYLVLIAFIEADIKSCIWCLHLPY